MLVASKCNRKGTRMKEAQRLGPLEGEIMEFIWDQDAPVSVRTVLTAIGGRRDLAYTTVMTVMHRLRLKGLLRYRKSGNAYLYSAKVDRAGYASAAIDGLLSGTEDRRSVLAAFVGSVDDADLAELRRLIRQAERERKTT